MTGGQASATEIAGIDLGSWASSLLSQLSRAPIAGLSPLAYLLLSLMSDRVLGERKDCATALSVEGHQNNKTRRQAPGFSLAVKRRLSASASVQRVSLLKLMLTANCCALRMQSIGQSHAAIEQKALADD